jgi:hypothetical protein
VEEVKSAEFFPEVNRAIAYPSHSRFDLSYSDRQVGQTVDADLGFKCDCRHYLSAGRLYQTDRGAQELWGSGAPGGVRLFQVSLFTSPGLGVPPKGVLAFAGHGEAALFIHQDH